MTLKEMCESIFNYCYGQSVTYNKTAATKEINTNGQELLAGHENRNNNIISLNSNGINRNQMVKGP